MLDVGGIGGVKFLEMPFKISGEDRMLEGILLVGGVTIFALEILFTAGTVDDRDTNELLGSTV